MKAEGRAKAGDERLGDAGAASQTSLPVFCRPWLPWQAQVCFIYVLLQKI